MLDMNILKTSSDSSETTNSIRGKPITCRVCESKFKIPSKSKLKWAHEKMICPSCGIQYSCLPTTERLLRIEQDNYLQTRDSKYLDLIYRICFPYSRSLLLKAKLSVIDSEDKLQYHSHNISTFLIEEYLKKPNFYIHVSFGRWLEKKIPQSVYGQLEHMIEDQSIDIVNENGNPVNQIPGHNKELNEVEHNEISHQIIMYLADFIGGIGDYCNSKEENMIRLLTFVNYLKLRNKETSIDTNKFFRHFGRKGKIMFEKTKDLLYQELMAMENCNA